MAELLATTRARYVLVECHWHVDASQAKSTVVFLYKPRQLVYMLAVGRTKYCSVPFGSKSQASARSHGNRLDILG